jgi:hypothetical protein
MNRRRGGATSVNFIVDADGLTAPPPLEADCTPTCGARAPCVVRKPLDERSEAVAFDDLRCRVFAEFSPDRSSGGGETEVPPPAAAEPRPWSAYAPGRSEIRSGAAGRRRPIARLRAALARGAALVPHGLTASPPATLTTSSATVPRNAPTAAVEPLAAGGGSESSAAVVECTLGEALTVDVMPPC